MIYVDTSALIPFYLPEASSDQVESAMLSAPMGTLAVSRWTLTEAASALARLIRMGVLSQEQATAVFAELRSDVAESFQLLTPGAADHDLAASLMIRVDHRLRAGDALHLALALNNEVESMWTFDSAFAECARAAGVPTTEPVGVS